MIKYYSHLFILFAFLAFDTEAQIEPDSTITTKEFSSLEEALKTPEQVYRLNLSNQAFQIPDSAWLKFTNLRYLSLKDDHLKQIPATIGYMKSLRVLDLSGNDFINLPSSFANLSSLKELYINDDQFFDLEKNIELLSTIPKLSVLHIENIGLDALPINTFKLYHIESLYLNKNQFTEIPQELNSLKKLKYVDVHDNKFKLPTQTPNGQGFGFKIRF